MNILEKIYLHLYWCGNKGKGGGMIDRTLHNVFTLPIFGLFMLIITYISVKISIDIKFIGLIVLSGVVSYFATGKLVDNYYSNKKRKYILTKYNKPGMIRYFILIILLIGGLGLAILSSVISGTIYNNYFGH